MRPPDTQTYSTDQGANTGLATQVTIAHLAAPGLGDSLRACLRASGYVILSSRSPRADNAGCTELILAGDMAHLSSRIRAALKPVIGVSDIALSEATGRLH